MSRRAVAFLGMPQVARMPVAMLDRTDLAMRAEVRPWSSDGMNYFDVYCPAGCPWEWTWTEPLSLAKVADAVQQHLTRDHGVGL